MLPQANPGGDLDAANSLLAHLRANPREAARPASELAAQFGLSEPFVRYVLDGIKIPRHATHATFAESIGKTARDVQLRLDGLFAKLTRRPLLYLIVTSVIGSLVCYILLRTDVGGTSSATRNANNLALSQSFGSNGPYIAIASLITIVSQLALFYRTGKSRHALYGGLLVFLTGMLLMVFGMIRKGVRVDFLVFGFVGFFSMGLVYWGAGTLVAVLGAWTQVRRQERMQANLTRHELLAQYFDLKRRLDQAGEQPAPTAENQLLQLIRKHIFVVAFVTNLIFSLIIFAVSSYFDVDPMAINASTRIPGLYLAFNAIFGTFQFMVYLWLMYLAGSVPRAIVASLLHSLASALVYLIPMHHAPGTRIPSTTDYILGNLATSVAFMGIASVTSLGSIMQARTKREKRLANNDPAALLAEMLQVQWRLSEGSTSVCVLAIDAARSAEMKATADPLEVEFSFRAYQVWIERISAHYEGRVHNTAGDGAIVAFPSASQAHEAAIALQRDIHRFNVEENRLKMPFRIRIGLHLGRVVAELDKVQFTDVIDIAAHVEGVAPVGGIAVTDSVVEELGSNGFTPLAHELDGHRVFTCDLSGAV